MGSGKTALVRQLCLHLRKRMSLAVVTNDIFTREDAEFLTKHQVLEADRISAVETGGCPHAAIREDISGNIAALRAHTSSLSPAPVLQPLATLPAGDWAGVKRYGADAASLGCLHPP